MCQLAKTEEYDGLVQEIKHDRCCLLRHFKRNRSWASKKAKYGVGGNTFRSFQGFNCPPSEIYRAWAKAYTEKEIEKKQPPMDEQGFLILREDAARDLERFWLAYQKEKSEKEGKKLSFAYKNKAVNLFFKYLTRTKEIKLEIRETILNYGHVPLDKYVLKQLGKFVEIDGLVGRNPAMGSVDNQETYDVLQAEIRKITEAAGVPNLVFDAYAWDEREED